MNIKIISILICVLFLAPSIAAALEMPASAGVWGQVSGLGAQSYIVLDAQSGQILIAKNENQTWSAASLTKLVTALVVLDTNPNFGQSVAMTKADQLAGKCSSGGACIKSYVGVKYTVDDLFRAALIPSANNAANALARSTGLSHADFVKKMNEKAASLGAVNSNFVEPTGIDSKNVITASDYAKISLAAFSSPYIRQVATISSYNLKAANNSNFKQTIKNTNTLLKDPQITILAAKTGHLDESGYNFSSLVQVAGGQQLVIVILGESARKNAFDETKQLAVLGLTARIFALGQTAGSVLGASTLEPNHN